MQQPAGNRPSRSYPLSALFLLVTACAVLAGLIAIAARGGIQSMLGVIVVGPVGLILGAMVGFFSQFRLRGVFIGGGMGLLIGAGSGTLALLPLNQLTEALIVCAVGSALMLTVGAITSRRRS